MMQRRFLFVLAVLAAFVAMVSAGCGSRASTPFVSKGGGSASADAAGGISNPGHSQATDPQIPAALKANMTAR